MKKYFIVADVHGFYDEMIEALNKKGYDMNNSNHVFVSLGDMFDRGKQAWEVLDFVNEIPNENKLLVLGNHELLMEEMLGRGFCEYHDQGNGTCDTMFQLTNANFEEEAIELMRVNRQWRKYINSCHFYHEVGDNIFVHGWIPRFPYNTDWRNATISEWKEATWLNGMKEWRYDNKEPGKTIWCGHWHVGYGHAHIHYICTDEVGGDAVYTPFKDEGIVAMDACTAVSHMVNCEVIEV